jgi:hypothetical protein
MSKELSWTMLRSGLLVADTGGHGRYSMRQERYGWPLKLNGRLLGTFRSADAAKTKAAEVEAFASHVRSMEAEQEGSHG